MTLKDRLFMGCVLMGLTVWGIPFIPIVPIIVVLGGFKGDSLGDALGSVGSTIILGVIVYAVIIVALTTKAFA